MKLRPYQSEFVAGVEQAWETNQSTLGVMATGLGKTVCFSHVIKRRGGRSLVLAHREELIMQAADKIEAVTGYMPDIEMADRWANDTLHGRAECVVSSIQTQTAGKNGGRMKRFDPDSFDTLIVDEAHHATARSYRKVLDWYKQNTTIKILGVTATPDRADEAALGKVFETVAFDYGILEGVQDGWLVPIEQVTVDVDDLDYSKVHTTAGDLNQKELAEILESEQIVHGIVSPTLEMCGDNTTLIFAQTLAQAEQIVDVLNRWKPNSARWVSGKTPKDQRSNTLAAFRNHVFQYLVNVGVFTEGFDEPEVCNVVMARPTKSRSLYTQMIGRGTRTLPGIVDTSDTLFESQHDDPAGRRRRIAQSAKTKVRVIDFVGNAGRHKLITSADILGGKWDDDVVAAAKKKAKDKPVDMAEALEEAAKEIHEQKRKEAERRKSVKAKAKYKARSIDPFDVLQIEPWREKPWNEGKPPSQKMIEALKRHGVDARDMSFTKASQLLDEVNHRRDEGLCTIKMANKLQSYGIDAKDMSFTQASDILQRIRENGWRKPANLNTEPQLVEISSW